MQEIFYQKYIDDKNLFSTATFYGNIQQDKISKFVIPIFGFVTSKDYVQEKPGESRPKHEFSTRPYFFNYEDPVEKEFDISNFKIKCNYSSDGELAVICKGRKGQGFWICFECGSAFSEKPKGKHKTPYGLLCSSYSRGPLHLGHTFKTDVISISFEEPNIDEKYIKNLCNASSYKPDDKILDSFWFSLLYAILEGSSQALGIKRQDLDGCLDSSESGNRIILFDNVPGGAGHVKRLMEIDNLNESLKSAWSRLKNCTCGPETSCYGCLRNYQNQFFHEKLRRGIILEFLKKNL